MTITIDGKRITVPGPWDMLYDLQLGAPEGYHWWDAGAFRFFGTRIESLDVERPLLRVPVLFGRFFITSDSPVSTYDEALRGYTIRVAWDDGRIGTHGHLRDYPTLDAARTEIWRLAEAAHSNLEVQ